MSNKSHSRGATERHVLHRPCSSGSPVHINVKYQTQKANTFLKKVPKKILLDFYCKPNDQVDVMGSSQTRRHVTLRTFVPSAQYV